MSLKSEYNLNVYEDTVDVVPSTFCIGISGLPVVVIEGHVSPENLVEKLQKAQQVPLI